MANMPVNEIAIDAIKSRAELGTATSQDCLDLLEYIENGVVAEEFVTRVEIAIDEVISKVTIDSSQIVYDVIRKLKTKK